MSQPVNGTIATMPYSVDTGNSRFPSDNRRPANRTLPSRRDQEPRQG